MNIKNILILFILCIIISHTYTMEKNRELIPLLKAEKINYNNDYNCPLFKLSIECLDTIIFYNQPQTIGALKNTCKYLASLASILRVDDLPIHHFIMPDNKERQTFFKRIVSMDNSEYIEKIIEHGRREAHVQTSAPQDATIITLDESLMEKEYLDRNYLPFLLKYAIKQNRFFSVFTIVNSGADGVYCDNQTPLEYAVHCDSDAAIRALFECNTFDTKQINYALFIACMGDKNKAAELLSTKTEDPRYYQYVTTLKEEPCARILNLIYTGTIVTLVITGGIIGLTLQILSPYHHNNITMH